MEKVNYVASYTGTPVSPADETPVVYILLTGVVTESVTARRLTDLRV